MVPKFVVVDQENDQYFGPYDSEAEAAADIIKMANTNGWTEVIEAGDFPFEGNSGLRVKLMTPSARLSPLEREFFEKMILAETNWPGSTEPGEPEPSKEDLDRGWAAIEELETEYTLKGVESRHIEDISTAISEAHADYARGGWPRNEIQTRLRGDLDTWEWEEN